MPLIPLLLFDLMKFPNFIQISYRHYWAYLIYLNVVTLFVIFRYHFIFYYFLKFLPKFEQSCKDLFVFDFASIYK